MLLLVRWARGAPRPPLRALGGPRCRLWGLHLECSPSIPAGDCGFGCTAAKDYVPVGLSLPTPPQHRSESAQVRKLTHLPHLALEKGLLSLPRTLESNLDLTVALRRE